MVAEVTVGHVKVWEPGERFVVSWEISAAWKPDARAEFASEGDVRFAADSAGCTRVEVEHRDFERGAHSHRARESHGRINQALGCVIHSVTITPNLAADP
jgi:hypothetical protein